MPLEGNKVANEPGGQAPVRVKSRTISPRVMVRALRKRFDQRTGQGCCLDF